MSRILVRIASAGVALAVALIWAAPNLTGQSGQPSTAKGRVAVLHGRPERLALLAARSDQRLELQQARGRVAIQDRQLRTVPGIQARRHAADGERRDLHDRRHAARRDRARRARPASRSGRTACAKASAPRCRRASCRAAACRLLDRRQGRRTHPLRDDRLPPRRAEREERQRHRIVRHARASSI